MVTQQPKDDEASFAFHLSGTTNAVDACQQIEIAIDFPQILHMSGSVSLIVEPYVKIYESILEKTNALKHFDPNPRALLIDSLSAKQKYLEQLLKWISMVDILKVCGNFWKIFFF